MSAIGAAVVRARVDPTLGFTLIEIAMVIIIVGIMSVAALPRFFSLATYHQAVYYQEILSALRYARKLAIATDSHIQVTVTANSITLQRRIEGSSCNTGTTFQTVIDPASQAGSYLRSAPGNVALTFSSQWPLYFDGLGQANQASTCTVITSGTVSIVGGNTVTVIGATGFVQ